VPSWASLGCPSTFTLALSNFLDPFTTSSTYDDHNVVGCVDLRDDRHRIQGALPG
jgi:hypothetical protein